MPPVQMDTSPDVVGAQKNFNDVVDTKFTSKSVLAASDGPLGLFKHLVNDAATPVSQVFVHLNAEAHDPNEFARGYSAVLESDAVVKIEYLHQNMFGQVMLFDIEPLADQPAFESSDFDGKQSKALVSLNDVVEQHTKNEASLANALFANKAQVSALRDGAKWTAALGDDGLVAVLKEEVGDDVYRFTLLVHIGSTQASKDLYNWVYSQEPGSLTYEAFLESPQFKYVESVNQRNAQRVAAKAAKALNVRIATTDDKLAHVTSPHEMPPQMAVPTVHNEYNTVRRATWAYKPAFLVYDNTYCTSKARGGLLLLQDPRSSVMLFPAPPSASKAANFPLNEAAASFPMSMGHALSTNAALLKASSTTMQTETVKSINKRVIWENKGRFSKTWSNHRVAPGFYKRLDIRGDDTQRRILASLYGNDLSAVRRLQPVIVKISADE